jgi:NarL family two-component system response regulator LiaR
VALSQDLHPSVVLLDLSISNEDGVTTIDQLHVTCPQTRIVALSATDDEVLVRKAIRAGALSLLLKNVAVPALIDAIRAANQGRSTLAQEATQALVGAMQRPPDAGHDLSDRELDTLMLMMRGLKNPEIASYMMVSTSTVKKHVSSIFAKLNVTNRLEAVTYALQHRILDK